MEAPKLNFYYLRRPINTNFLMFKGSPLRIGQADTQGSPPMQMADTDIEVRAVASVYKLKPLAL